MSWFKRWFSGGEPSGADSRADASEWQRTWDARRAALEALLGRADEQILTSMMPIYLGGRCDVLTFHKPPGGGVAYVTAGLTGTSPQPPSSVGNYELMIRTRADEDWAGGLVSDLSNYTLQTPVKPNDTIDLGEHQPPDVTVRALLALEPDPPLSRFDVFGQRYAILLLVGLTSGEFGAYRSGRADDVLAALRTSVLPYTDLKRASVV